MISRYHTTRSTYLLFFYCWKCHKAVLERLAVGSSGHTGGQGYQIGHGTKLLWEVFVLGEFAQIPNKNSCIEHRVWKRNIFIPLSPNQHFHHIGIPEVVVVDHPHGGGGEGRYTRRRQKGVAARGKQHEHAQHEQFCWRHWSQWMLFELCSRERTHRGLWLALPGGRREENEDSCRWVPSTSNDTGSKGFGILSSICSFSTRFSYFFLLCRLKLCLANADVSNAIDVLLIWWFRIWKSALIGLCVVYSCKLNRDYVFSKCRSIYFNHCIWSRVFDNIWHGLEKARRDSCSEQEFGWTGSSSKRRKNLNHEKRSRDSFSHLVHTPECFSYSPHDYHHSLWTKTDSITGILFALESSVKKGCNGQMLFWKRCA